MKKLLLIALAAAMFAGVAEARRCGRNRCDKQVAVCAPKCEQKSNCIGPARVTCTTYSNDCNEGPQPDVCYLVPARRNITKHIHRTEETTYSCGEKPCCAVEPTEQQLNDLRDGGAIPASCNNVY